MMYEHVCKWELHKIWEFVMLKYFYYAKDVNFTQFSKRQTWLTHFIETVSKKLLNWLHPRYSNFGQSQLAMDPPLNIAIYRLG